MDKAVVVSFVLLGVDATLGYGCGIWEYLQFQFKLKYNTKTNLNMQNSMVVFNFSVFDRKYSFRVDLVEKIKIVSLSWNFYLD